MNQNAENERGEKKRKQINKEAGKEELAFQKCRGSVDIFEKENMKRLLIKETINIRSREKKGQSE